MQEAINWLRLKLLSAGQYLHTIHCFFVVKVGMYFDKKLMLN